MSYLLDTHAFLWWITDDPQLGERVRAILVNATNRVYFSAASAWEIAIKVGLGLLDLHEDVPLFVPRQIAANRFAILAIEVQHALYVAQLPTLHRDPFDRLLIAQARVEGLILLSTDPLVRQYQVPTLW